MDRGIVVMFNTYTDIMWIIFQIIVDMSVDVERTITNAMEFMGNMRASEVFFCEAFPVHYLIKGFKANTL